MQAAILAGGMGTRIRSLFPNLPKPMVPVNGVPFLEFQMNTLYQLGINRFALCIGYMADLIEDHFSRKRFPYEVLFSVENEPLGTGGAISNALRILDKRFLVVNGDTFVTFDLHKLEQFHTEKKSDCTMLLARREDAEAYGTVEVDAGWRVTGFVEKKKASGQAYVNAGICLAEKHIFEGSTGVFSLERDMLPKLLKGGRVFGHPNLVSFEDIGTPERFLAFKRRIEG